MRSCAGRSRPGRWHRPTSGGRGESAHSASSGTQASSRWRGPSREKLDLHDAVAVEVGDGAAQPAPAAEVDVDVDGRRRPGALGRPSPRLGDGRGLVDDLLRRVASRAARAGVRRAATPCRASPGAVGRPSRSRSIRSPTSHCSRPSSSTGSPSVTSSPSSGSGDLEPAAQELLDRVLEEGTPGRRARRPPRPARAATSAQAGGAAPARGARPGRRSSAARSKENGRSRRASRLRRSNACSGWRRSAWSLAPGGGGVEGVEQLPEGYGGRPRLARRLVGAGVGDHEVLGRGDDRVEHQLAVLAAHVALAGERAAGEHVVAVDRAGPREDAVVETEQADHAVRAPSASAPACATVSVPVRKLARVGRPASRSRISARTSGSRSSSAGSAARRRPSAGQLRWTCADCHSSPRATAVSCVDPVAAARQPVGHRAAAGRAGR